MMITTMRQMKKQIHRFFLAERADATAFSVYPRLQRFRERRSYNPVT